jgi:hypothetical protein
MKLTRQEPDPTQNQHLHNKARTCSLLAYHAIRGCLRERDIGKRHIRERDVGVGDIRERDIGESDIKKRGISKRDIHGRAIRGRDIRETVATCQLAE